MYHGRDRGNGTYLWRHRISSGSWRRESCHRYMSGSALCENVGFPSASGHTAVPRLCRYHSWTTSQSTNHPVYIRFAHFSIFEYPSNTRKIHGRKIKQKVEVELSRKSTDNKDLGITEEGFKGLGRDQVVAVIWAAECRAFS